MPYFSRASVILSPVRQPPLLVLHSILPGPTFFRYFQNLLNSVERRRTHLQSVLELGESPGFFYFSHESFCDHVFEEIPMASNKQMSLNTRSCRKPESEKARSGPKKPISELRRANVLANGSFF